MPRTPQSRDTSSEEVSWRVRQARSEEYARERQARTDRAVALQYAVQMHESAYGTPDVSAVLKTASAFEGYLNGGKIESEPEGIVDNDPLAEWEKELLTTPAPHRRAPRRSPYSRSQQAAHKKGNK